MNIPLKIYHPLNTLKPVGKDIWLVDGGVVEMPLGVVKVPFTTRMTVVRLSNGGLWLHSPIAPSRELIEELSQLGPIQHLIAPNKLHYSYVEAWKNHFPEAKAWLAPGVLERAASQSIPISCDQRLTQVAPQAWAGDLDQHLFQGSRFMEEVVLFHQSSRTLILTDLIENIETEQMRFCHRLLYKLGDNTYPMGKTPRDLRLTFWGHHQMARASLAVLRDWGADNIILAHGVCHFGNGRAELERAFAWLD